MKISDQKGLFWRRAFTVCKVGFFSSFVGGLAYSAYLQAARPREPVTEQGLTVPVKVFSEIYVTLPEARALHTVMLVTVVLVCATIYCYTKAAANRV